MQEKRRFDPARITRLLHYEQIPQYVMTDEQKKYLEDWRREALNRPTFAKQKAQEAVVVTVNTKSKKKTAAKKEDIKPVQTVQEDEPTEEPVQEPEQENVEE